MNPNPFSLLKNFTVPVVGIAPTPWLFPLQVWSGFFVLAAARAPQVSLPTASQ
jgi:hypothetical protein